MAAEQDAAFRAGDWVFALASFSWTGGVEHTHPCVMFRTEDGRLRVARPCIDEDDEELRTAMKAVQWGMCDDRRIVGVEDVDGELIRIHVAESEDDGDDATATWNVHYHVIFRGPSVTAEAIDRHVCRAARLASYDASKTVIDWGWDDVAAFMSLRGPFVVVCG